MNSSQLLDLARGCLPMSDFQRIATLSHLLLSTTDIPGDVCEFGCYEGRTAMLMAALMPSKRLVLYDSFEGLPERSQFDTGRADLSPGALRASPVTVRENFERAGLTQPEIVNGWFNKVHEFEVPKLISFCHIDGDYFLSTYDALSKIFSRLVSGAVCVIDDYAANDLPGVKKAVEHFFRNNGTNNPKLIQPPNSVHAYFIKK